MSPALKAKPASPRAKLRPTATESVPRSQPAPQPPASETAWQVVWLPVTQIDPNPYQPRTSFDAAEMAEMVASVRAHGVLQPVTVRTVKADAQDEKVKPGEDHRNGSAKGHANANGHANGGQTAPLRYHLISGERRLRACREAGRREIPAIVRDDLNDVAVAELALIENVQRSNLSVIEEAAAYKRLMLEFRLKEERLAKKVGKSVATIKETIKLLGLPQPVQQMLSEKKLTPSHGQQLLRLAPFPEVCRLVANKAVSDHLTAISLGQTPLPNVRELRDKNLLIELGHNTQFEWREVCGKCPHNAYVQSGYGSYCLNPNDWHRKQADAIEMKKQEAA
ncbi:MAG TPA: ParB/RepB/Spo0J family partition protein [Chloroflexota bacterium]|nr:ParB/RepB/Spo0J family partition protein [Chloroflexota bacterium]